MTDATERIVLGYYPGWECGLAPERIDFRLFTHIAHAFAVPGPDALIRSNLFLPSRKLTDLAHAAGTMVILSLGGGGGSDHFSAIMKDDELAKRFVETVGAMIRDNGYDGIDVDWEFPVNEADSAGLVNLVRALRESMPGMLLTMAVNASDHYGRWFRHAELLPLYDLLNVMTYDFHGPWDPRAGHNAPLFGPPEDPDGKILNTAAGMAYWNTAKSWPKNRLLVGIPSYGRGFLAARWYDNVSGKSSHGYISLLTARQMITEGWTRNWDPHALVPYLSKPGTGELISYEDEQSAELKGKWARDEGYRGIFFWEISRDFSEGTHAVVAAARKGFLG
jgi:chitinase